ncbi:ABC transporter permease [Candidatus Woesearchaeota archaeon]|nr:MAG: ABC transporter permease [Candidatus Woesearchaeota archaeon]
MIELFRIAVRNVLKRKKRAALTMLGVFIGITAVVALISLGQGLQQTINEQFEKVGADKIIIQAKEAGFTGQFAAGKMTEREAELTAKVQGVKNTAGYLFRSTTLQYNKIQRAVYISSIPDKPKEADLIWQFLTAEIEDGRKISHNDKLKANIGYDLAHKKTFQKNIQIGDKIKAGNYTLEVVGSFLRTGDPTFDTGIVVPEDTVRLIVGDNTSFSMVVAQAAPTFDPETVAERIKKEIRSDRHQKERKEDFTVQTSTQLIESFNSVFLIIQVVFVGIAAISLVVGGVGIMNTMYTSVLERTREIGVMKAIGARNKDILTLFIIESGLLGLAGGIIGVLLGTGLSTAVSFGANSAFGPNTINAAYPPALIIGALLFSLITGTLSGVLPARRASKLKPVEALRDE